MLFSALEKDILDQDKHRLTEKSNRGLTRLTEDLQIMTWSMIENIKACLH